MAEIAYPEADYKINQVGPDKAWDFNSDRGTIAMKTFSVQLEGVPNWVDFNQKAEEAAPTVGQVIKGSIEDAGKYGFKFKKTKSGGSWSGGGGGGKASPGAIWATCFATASSIVAGYYAASGTKPTDAMDYFSKVQKMAGAVKVAVDKEVASAAPAEAPKAETPKTTSESGESPASEAVVVEGIKDADLGTW